MTNAGKSRKNILDNLFRTKSVSNTNIHELFNDDSNPFHSKYYVEKSFVCDSDTETKECDQSIKRNKYSAPFKANKFNKKITQCQELSDTVNPIEFMEKYLKKSQPLIIRGGARKWDAISKWSSKFLRQKYGHLNVHVKMTPGGDYEGIENANEWEDFAKFNPPEYVKEQLLYPDLVVVRPAGVDMKFGKFLELIEKSAANKVI